MPENNIIISALKLIPKNFHKAEIVAKDADSFIYRTNIQRDIDEIAARTNKTGLQGPSEDTLVIKKSD